MAWKKTANVAQFKGADWSNFIQKVPNCTAEEAKRIALKNPQISFFFFCRTSMVLEGPVYEKYGPFNPNDAVFFSGKPWYGSADQCDSYEKEGVFTAYISPNDNFSLRDVANFTLADGSPAIDIVCLGAGNFATLDEKPYLRAENNQPVTDKPFNPNIQKVLDDGSVQFLQSKGITVLLTVMNAHTPVGWSEFTSAADATKFADYLKTDVVDKYGFDGIDIDDEYSAGTPNNSSLIMVTAIMKTSMPDKIISKALFSDIDYFPPNSYHDETLVQTLDFGWEMTYFEESAENRLSPYSNAGMDKSRLSYGYYSNFETIYNIPKEVSWLKSNGYGGAMIFAFEEQSNRDLMTKVINSWCE
ncbi:MAG: glycosyl hydrolase family 18 protein [Fluviicola sp.]|nr:glycosyl hydrolase family 18 protein [Fluviicola sp.]